MENPPKLGRLCNGTEPRDAVHVAVVVVTAGEVLQPGAKVVILKNKTADMPAVEYVARQCENQDAIGVVDPFLPLPVGQGQQFYLFLKPLTVVGLRHDWSHPALDQEIKRPQHRNERIATSIKWIENLAVRLETDYVTLVGGASLYLKTGTLLSLPDPERHEPITREELQLFWHHYGVLTDTDTKYVNPEFIVVTLVGD